MKTLLVALFLMANAYSFESGIYEGTKNTSHCLINLTEDSSGITINTFQCKDTSNGLELSSEKPERYNFGAYHEVFEQDGKQFVLTGVSSPNILNYNINEVGKTFSTMAESVSMIDKKTIHFSFAMSDGDSPLSYLLDLDLTKK